MSVVNSNRSNRVRREQILVAAALMVWLAAVACGWRALGAYAFNSDGIASTAPATWPDDSQLPHETGRGELVVFLHPKCPCSRATLTELERMLIGPSGAAHPDAHLVVVAVTPSSPSGDWTKTPLVERSQRLPAAELFVDRGGVEAARFGAINSGTVIYFDAEGRRRYYGGVTLARGHEGQNLGEAALAQIMAGDDRSLDAFPALGCRLVSEQKCVIADEYLGARLGGARPSVAATPQAPGTGANE